MDERSIWHRYKATRWSITAGTLVIFAWFLYDFIFKDTTRWDFLIILLTMAAVKLIARFYYKKIN